MSLKKFISPSLQPLTWFIPLILLIILILVIHTTFKEACRVINEMAEERTIHTAEQIFTRLELFFFERTKDLSHLTMVTEDAYPQLPSAIFIRDASGIISREPIYESIGLYDSLGEAIITIPEQNTLQFLLPPAQLRRAAQDSIILLSPPLESPEEVFILALIVPFRSEGQSGSVAAIIYLEDIIAQTIEITAPATKRVSFFMEEILVYRNELATRTPGDQTIASSTSMHILGREITLLVEQPITGDIRRLHRENRNRYALSLVMAILSSTLLFFAFISVARTMASRRLMQATEDRYKRLTENARDMIFRFSIPQRKFDYVSPAGFNLTGFHHQEFYKNPGIMISIIAPEWRDYFKDRWLRLMQGDAEPLYEFRIIGKSSESRWVHLRVVVIKKDGQPHAIEGIAADVTELKNALEEREKLIKELETKNAELERFAYTISHELKTPLITIRGFLGYLEKEAREGDLGGLYRDITFIRSATDTMRRLLEGLIELTRVGRHPGEPEDVPFSKLVSEVAQRFEKPLSERKIILQIDTNMPVVHGNRIELFELVENLIENSIKFMGDQQNPYIKVGWFETPKEAVFYVKDNGIGIEPKYHDRVFGIFHKLDPASEGTGVGLALAKSIVSTHGGWIKTESPGPGKGTAVYFTLPVKH
ncbi:ATP-binding protein [Chitinispirillales bacterium ANBcel5]|uniref:sensor histidine kinase n=1 Tax=Cellulosispirillum alkaliphilum TaxID=3039283 RepID=UPI002A505E19|nr:ATP-binding protein [Chitinispirillales bacterium ANBcel5]